MVRKDVLAVRAAAGVLNVVAAEEESITPEKEAAKVPASMSDEQYQAFEKLRMESSFEEADGQIS
jgi:hypothetical protein